MIEQHGSQQEEGGGQGGGDDVFETGRETGRSLVQGQQAIGRQRRDLDEDEQVEQVAGHHHAADAHDQDQVDRHGGRPALEILQQVPDTEGRRQIDRQYDKGLEQAESAD